MNTYQLNKYSKYNKMAINRIIGIENENIMTAFNVIMIGGLVYEMQNHGLSTAPQGLSIK